MWERVSMGNEGIKEAWGGTLTSRDSRQRVRM